MISVCEFCERCKRYIKQGGTCNGYGYKCLHYDEEPRGKIITKSIKILCAGDYEMPIIKPRLKLDLEGLDEVVIREIKSVDTVKKIVEVTADVYSELYKALTIKRNFKVLKGGKE